MSDGNGDDDDDNDNDDNDQLRYLQDALRKLAVKNTSLVKDGITCFKNPRRQQNIWFVSKHLTPLTFENIVKSS